MFTKKTLDNLSKRRSDDGGVENGNPRSRLLKRAPTSTAQLGAANEHICTAGQVGKSQREVKSY